jgi:hypothetical protein
VCARTCTSGSARVGGLRLSAWTRGGREAAVGRVPGAGRSAGGREGGEGARARMLDESRVDQDCFFRFPCEYRGFRASV